MSSSNRIYFMTGKPDADVTEQQILKISKKAFDNLQERIDNEKFKVYADSEVRRINVLISLKKGKPDQIKLVSYHKLKFDVDGWLDEADSQDATEDAYRIWNQSFSDAWSNSKENSNEFDAIEFSRRYIWTPTEQERNFITNFIITDLNLNHQNTQNG